MRKSQNWQHHDVQFRRLCGQKPWWTMEVCRYRKQQIGHIALYIPQQCVVFLVDLGLHRYELIHIRSHAATYSRCFWLYVPCINPHPGLYFRWLQMQRCGGLTAFCGAAVSRPVGHCLKCLLFGSIPLLSHLGQVYLEQWLVVVERGGRGSWDEVGSAEHYIVSYKSK
jgi:hypothetical protein